MEGKVKKSYLELVRIVACFLVIVNHTNSGIFLSQVPGTKTWIISISYFFLCKVAVPVFLMISGTLLLTKIDSYKKAAKRIGRIVLVVIIFSFLYYVRACSVGQKTFSIWEFFSTIWNSNMTNSFWYMYIYMGILVFLPTFQRFASGLDKKDYEYFLCLLLGFRGVMPILTHYNPQIMCSGYFSIIFMSAYIGIFFLGYYIDHYVDLDIKKVMFSMVILILTIFAEVILTWGEYKKTPDWYLFYDDCVYIPIIISSICIFCILKYIGLKLNGTFMEKVVIAGGRVSFGIYLFSDFLIDIFSSVYSQMLNVWKPLIAVFIFEILIFISGGVITAVLLKIPGVKKLL